METVRTFIAIDIGGEVREGLSRLQRKLKGAHADVKWVKPENIHLTLAFLSEVAIGNIRPLEAAMDQAFLGLEKFSLKVAGTGTFGKPGRPRVVWAGMEESSPLVELRERTVGALHAAGIHFDAKPFSPHLTLGRVESPKHISALLDKLELEKDSAIGGVGIAEVRLIKSEPRPGGAKYTVLHRTPLS